MKCIYLLVLSIFLIHYENFCQEGMIMTVNGPITPSEMGTTLIHEHVMVDFIGADSTGYHRWDPSEVILVAQPFVEQANHMGVKTIFECTPSFLGRDPRLLKKLSLATQTNFITNTGYYGALDNKFLPEHAFTESAGQLSKRWIEEWENGIEESDIRPGFIKIGVNEGSLSDLHSKLIQAAGITHLQSGLTIASHTGEAVPAFEQLEVLEGQGISPEAFVWVHAQSEKDLRHHVKAAQKGAWVSLDGLNETNLNDYLEMVKNLKENGYLHKVLISHDAGWYSPGENNGGNYRGYTIIFEKFIPLLLKNKFTQADIDQLLITNPGKAFEIRVRKQ